MAERIVIEHDPRELFSLYGRLVLPSGAGPKTALRIEHPRYDCTRIECELSAPEGPDSLREIGAAVAWGQQTGITLSTGSTNNYFVKLFSIQGWTQDSERLLVNSNWYECAFDTFESYDSLNDQILNVRVELQPPGILSKWGTSEHHPDGTVLVKHGYDDEVQWTSTLGPAKAAERYVYEAGLIAGSRARIQIARPTLWFEVADWKSISPFELFARLDTELQPTCMLLSLAYRRRVTWYEIAPMVRHKADEDVGLPLPMARRTLHLDEYPERTDPLIDHRDLIQGGFDALVAEYRRTPIQGIDRVIAYLSASWAANSLETKFFQCYSALEALTGNILAAPGLDISVPSDAGIGKRISICAEALGAKTQDLWPRQGFEKGLRGSISGRNKLFHAAHVQDPSTLYGDFVRLRTLLERMLMAALKWPEEKIWRWYDQELKFLGTD